MEHLLGDGADIQAVYNGDGPANLSLGDTVGPQAQL